MAETTTTDLQTLIAEAASRPDALESAEHVAAVEETIARLDRGELRMADKIDGEWHVNAWVQQAILLYFRTAPMGTLHAGPLEFHDRIPLKHDYDGLGVRVLPGAIARYGSHIEPGVILAPCFVNIGSYVATGSLVDTWATVGSGAQIGRNVHLAGGVGIGGVLEPPGARPVIIEDDAFIGSRCIVVEGVIVEERAVLAAQVSLTASTHIIDVTGEEPVTHKGRVPTGAIVVPGTRPRTFAAGEFEVGCALIIGRRTDGTDEKVRLNDVIREFGLSV
ncbi:MAG: 2,3,4,5-tetrahydropyridine-2,6-dicarboxylate N-succinyltransferase [Acidimicrobiales bacterium]